MNLESPYAGQPGRFWTVLLVVASLCSFSSAQTCPPPYNPDPFAFSSQDYISARQECTDACNELGYCCNVGFGGYEKVPCTTGCHIAFFSADLAACYAECNNANTDTDGVTCEYTHERHPDVADLGFNPYWTDWTNREWAVSTCRDSYQCGCPAGTWNTTADANEGSDAACLAGCDLANDPSRSANFFRGLDVMLDPRMDLDGIALLDALVDLTEHVNGTMSLSELDLLIRKQIISDNQALLETTLPLINTAMDLVDQYESIHGPLFINAKTDGGFYRESTSDGKNLERVILFVQQAIMDQVYHGSLYEFTMYDKPFEAVVAECRTELGGRKWLTSQFFPGHVAPPADKSVIHTVNINATMSTFWGKSVAYCDKQVIRPTGLYLAPGEIASVTVPAAMVNAGFRIQVGANTIDNANKNYHLRMDRITSTYDIKATTTYVANPLGGGIYIRIPYQANLGPVTVNITGGVVQAPIFSKTSIKTTTENEWNTRRIAPGPWADFETDRFLLQVPRIWMYALSYAHVNQTMTNWDLALEGALEFSGFLSPSLRNNYVLYVNPDLHIRHNVYGIGYPQVNNQLSANTNGPQAYGTAGASSHWLLNDPVGWDTDYHELGHQFDHTRYRGETEAIVNLLITYAQNVKFGVDFNQSFINSFPRTGYFTPDGAAINWMVAENFRNGDDGGPIPGEMRHEDPYNQFQYQHRGYAKYADIARLFGGWQVIADFNYQENMDIMNNTQSPCPGLSDEADYRTFKLSLVVGEDLTPLIHFWGIHPVNAAALAQCMQTHNLTSSLVVKQQIEHYKSIIPMTNAAFLAHFEEVWPGMKDKGENDPGVGPYGWRCITTNDGVPIPPDQLYGCAWYNHWYPQWNEAMATATVDAVQNVLDMYYPELPSSSPSFSGSTFPTLYVNCGSDTEIPDGSRSWLPDLPYLNNKNAPDYSTETAIANVGDYPEAMYQSERYDDTGLGLVYTIPNVDPGIYEVKIHLAEIYFTGSGQRVMGVTVEGIPVIQSLDIVQTVGAFTAFVETHEVEVWDGAITIQLVAGVENPKISGFEIRQIAAPSGAPSLGPSISPSMVPSLVPSTAPAHPGFVSEVYYRRSTSEDYIEVILPPEASSYSLVIYDKGGRVKTSYILDDDYFVKTVNGAGDLYLVNEERSVGVGTTFQDLTNEHGVALVGGSGNTLISFISFKNTITGRQGPALAQTADRLGETNDVFYRESVDDGFVQRKVGTPGVLSTDEYFSLEPRGFIAQVSYDDGNFMEVAVPQDVDPETYSIIVYDKDGNIAFQYNTLGTKFREIGTFDSYVLDGERLGNDWNELKDEYAIALISSGGLVDQIVSFKTFITVIEGDFVGLDARQLFDAPGTIYTLDEGANYDQMPYVLLTLAPTSSSTAAPSPFPSVQPSQHPSTAQPSTSPSTWPSQAPSTGLPSLSPSRNPSVQPSQHPSTAQPSMGPSTSPSQAPSTAMPSLGPSSTPSEFPTVTVSMQPSQHPSLRPSDSPSLTPTTAEPSSSPSIQPSQVPTTPEPSGTPSSYPTLSPSTAWPSLNPSTAPSGFPTLTPSVQPSRQPSLSPSSSPSRVAPAHSGFISEAYYRRSASEDYIEVILPPGASSYSLVIYDKDGRVKTSYILDDDYFVKTVDGAGDLYLVNEERTVDTTFQDLKDEHGVALVEDSSNSLISFISFKRTITGRRGPAQGITADRLGETDFVFYRENPGDVFEPREVGTPGVLSADEYFSPEPRGFVSQVSYDDGNFMEVAIPLGIDPETYSIIVYDKDGKIDFQYDTLLGEKSRVDDVNFEYYILDQDRMSGWNDLKDEHAIAVISSGGLVDQIVSFKTFITIIEGDFVGLDARQLFDAPGTIYTLDEGNNYYEKPYTPPMRRLLRSGHRQSPRSEESEPRKSSRSETAEEEHRKSPRSYSENGPGARARPEWLQLPDQAFKGVPFEKDTVRTIMETAKGLWKRFGPKNYDFEFELDFYGPQELRGPFIVEVRNGEVTNMYERFSGLPAKKEITFELPTKMEDWFDLIKRSLDQLPKYLGVDYSPFIGHPKRVIVVPDEEKRRLGEGGRAIYYIRNFTPR